MKILIIGKCTQCRHINIDMEPFEYICGKENKIIQNSEEIPGWCPLDSVEENLRAIWFEKGQLSVKRKNKSGCICIINDADEVVSVCLAHKAWMEEQC